MSKVRNYGGSFPIRHVGADVYRYPTNIPANMSTGSRESPGSPRSLAVS